VSFWRRDVEDAATRECRLLFLVGTGRCGSTLVANLIAARSGVGFVSRLDNLSAPIWIGRFNGFLYRQLPPQSMGSPVRFTPSEGYRAIRREIGSALVDPVRDLTQADAFPWLVEGLRDFFGKRARAQRSAVFMHKFTGWSRVGLLQAAFPNASFVHVVRDGRAVANSLLHVSWWRGWRGPERWGFGPLAGEDTREWEASGRSFPVLAGLEWRILMDSYDAAARLVGPQHWMTIRYEDVVTDPTASLGGILAEVGLPLTDEFARRVRRHRITAERVDAFRSDLTPADLDSLNRLLERHLVSKGYSVP
jgi:omega-hydroxy-beta-dihydromenaquinone-9 sulfotransferase